MAAKTENGEGEDKLFSARNDEYGGVIVHINDLMDPATFLSFLTSSIARWKLQGKKGVWIKLPIERVNLVEIAVKEGFWYHHAEPNHLMLVYWIPHSAHTLPANATHRVGIGAFLLNQNGEAPLSVRSHIYGILHGNPFHKHDSSMETTKVDGSDYRNTMYSGPMRNATFKLKCGIPHLKVLVVQEKGGQYRGTGVWKLPTGAVDEGEDIFAAAVREVKEETGIDSEFMEILAFRQSHKSFFEKSDLFFLCLLRPLSFDIQKQEQEIEAAKWMPFEEYAAQPFVQKYELLKYMNEICKASIDGKYTGFSPVPTTSYSVHKSYLYLNSTRAPKRDSKL